MTTRDPWEHLRRLTPARLALGRAGSALPTAEVLRFALAHAQARDAVHIALDAERLEADLWDAGFPAMRVESAVPDRATYLARPDLGRRLSDRSRGLLSGHAAPRDLTIVVADGLSSPAAVHAVPLLRCLRPFIEAAGLVVAPIIVATQARVALGDEIGERLGARAVLVLIGERPGLSAPDSLGAYLTYAPCPGRMDAERNCLSNIRAAGLPYELAAFKLAWLIDQALTRQLTGIALKDDSDGLVVEGRVPTALPPRERG